MRISLVPFAGALLLRCVFAGVPAAAAQGSIQTMGFPQVNARLIIAPESAHYVRNSPPSDPVIRRIWEEETQHSQIPALGQYLADVIGPRLTGSPAQEKASDWAISSYRSWGLTARRENYGTWLGWSRGITHLDLIAPRVRSLEATQTSSIPAPGVRRSRETWLPCPAWIHRKLSRPGRPAHAASSCW